MREMIFLSTFLLLIPCFFGISSLYVLYGSFSKKNLSIRDGYLVGIILCVGLAELAHLMGGFSGWSFSRCVDFLKMLFELTAGLCLAADLVAMLIHGIRRRKGKEETNRNKGSIFTSAEYLMSLVLLACVAGCLAQLLLANNFSLYKDLTPELTASFLQTDQIFGVNPTTGLAYATEVPMRFRILCLPTLYGALCKWSGVSVSTLCFRIIPVVVFFLALCAFSVLAKALWPEKRSARLLFLIIVVGLFFLSDAGEGQVGFELFHQGFSPQTLRIAVLIPFTIRLLLNNRYLLVLLTILAEACIVWTFFGTGWCFLIALLWIVIELIGVGHRMGGAK